MSSPSTASALVRQELQTTGLNIEEVPNEVEKLKEDRNELLDAWSETAARVFVGSHVG